jgi:dipeptidyl aminopeptidase/acylaminoacyl peptidase
MRSASGLQARARLIVGVLVTLLGVLIMSAVKPPDAAAQMPPLIPRAILLGNPARSMPWISPDGAMLAWLAPDSRDVMQVWVETLGKNDARSVTSARKRGIPGYVWGWDSKTILYAQDSEGDENSHLFAVELSSRNVRDLTPWDGVRSELVALNPKYPGRLLAAMNLCDRKLMDVYRIDLRSGAVELDTQNPGDISGWLADSNMVVRAAILTTVDGGTEIRVRTSASAPWRTLIKAGIADQLGAPDFSGDGRSIFIATSVGRDTVKLVEHQLATGKETEIAHSDLADLGGAMIHPTRHVVEAVSFDPGRMQWQVVDPAIRADFDGISKIGDGNFNVISRDLADKTWIVEVDSDRKPESFYSWDRAARKATFLFAAHPRLESAGFASMKPIEFVARDGMKLNGYLTIPAGVTGKNLPTVVAVHGGPDSRDRWGFDPGVQMLANRGYAVLQINFRGSTGFGKKYINAGDHEWGLKMQDDLTDGVGWAVRKTIADPKRVAIYGGSYGGYAALAGAAFTPELYRCAVDLCGPANLFTLFASLPPYWGQSARNALFARVGNPDDPKDKAMLTRASPLFAADKIRIPMLVGQGGNDPRVKQAEAEQIVGAIAKHNGTAVYVLYSDEGHGLARPENRLDFYARVEKFLADNLGGRYEPMTEERMSGSTAKVRVIGTSHSN